MVIAGRRTMYRGPFRRIGSLERGDRIRVTTGQGVAHYVVTDVRSLAPGDGSFVQNQDDDRLTLFTSASPWSADGRLVVTAKLDGEPFAATELQRRLDADGLGLTGERDTATNLLVWLELLAGAALLTAYLRVAVVTESHVARVRAGARAAAVDVLRERRVCPRRSDATSTHGESGADPPVRACRDTASDRGPAVEAA